MSGKQVFLIWEFGILDFGIIQLICCLFYPWFTKRQMDNPRRVVSPPYPHGDAGTRAGILKLYIS